MQRKGIQFSVVALTSLMAVGTNCVAVEQDVAKSIVGGLAIGGVAKLVGNTAYKDADFSMGASLTFATIIAGLLTCAACSHDAQISLPLALGTEAATYAALTKMFPHKKKNEVVVIIPQFDASRFNAQRN